jgi:uncharacterized membrane protein YraQ (UPF0718 family)
MLEKLGHWFAIDLLRLTEGSRLAETAAFFAADVVKIFVLLVSLIFVIGVARSFIPQDALKRWMSRQGVWGHVFAAFFGAVTPFCSCSSIPIFFAFLKAGVPLGPTLSFLITSPIINEYLVVLMGALFGWKVALAYVVSGLFIGIVSGMILGAMRLERYLVEDFARSLQGAPKELRFPTFVSRLRYGWSESWSITSKIWLWILVGVGVGAFIHNYVPQNGLDAWMKAAGFWSVPLATLIGVPLYGSCSAIVPVAVALFQKGIPLGTALSFMTAVSALSFPEAILLRRAMRLQMILIFFGVVTLSIILTGYIFNALQPYLY